MRMPTHPGEILREDVLKELNLGVTEAAAWLGMSRPALSRVLNCHAAISPDLAVRLEMAGISTARAWMALQTKYALAKAWQHDHPPIKRVDDGQLEQA